MKHVQFVRGKCFARMTVPEKLRPILGMRELVQPLGGDKKQAPRQAVAALNRRGCLRSGRGRGLAEAMGLDNRSLGVVRENTAQGCSTRVCSLESECA